MSEYVMAFDSVYYMLVLSTGNGSCPTVQAKFNFKSP
jgi:hypothetical protein